MAPHPARFSDDILKTMDLLLPTSGAVLDPFAGTGRIHELATDDRHTYGVEIEHEWAAMHPGTICGDSTQLSHLFPGRKFDAIATSPTYGNRMADHHQAKDGSLRMTYRHRLGRALTPNNTGMMQWGQEYRDLHEQVYRECVTVTKPGGYFLLNIKDHIRGGKRVKVTEWHLDTLHALGYWILVWRNIPTKGMGFGANHDKRVDNEHVIKLQLREVPPSW